MRRVAVALLLALALGSCGGSSSSESKPQLTVSAASSLRDAFTEYGKTFTAARVRFSFAGSDELAAQIRAGGKVDVYAAANTKLPDELHAEGKVDAPVELTANRLVLAAPSDSSRVKTLDDLSDANIKIAIGSAGVPIGSYTRQVLDHLPAEQRNRILANVKSEEPDAAGIVGKLTQGAVDAGFVYATDVQGAKGSLRSIQLPDDLQPTVVYAAAVVKGTKHQAEAQHFLDGLTREAGQQFLRRAGFLPLP
jgi:molybdate transport system substrate-binding protein